MCRPSLHVGATTTPWAIPTLAARHGITDAGDALRSAWLGCPARNPADKFHTIRQRGPSDSSASPATPVVPNKRGETAFVSSGRARSSVFLRCAELLSSGELLSRCWGALGRCLWRKNWPFSRQNWPPTRRFAVTHGGKALAGTCDSHNPSEGLLSISCGLRVRVDMGDLDTLGPLVSIVGNPVRS